MNAHSREDPPGVRRRLLYIAYHFPPLQGSTGIARTLAFARYLPERNWDVTVLTVRPSAYPEIREQNNASIPSNVRVVRSLAFDTQRHLSVRGRYPLFLAIPDRLQSWIPFGSWRALRIVREWRPHAIVSTYPLASAHCIGYVTHRLTGIPWIADFRDPMAQPNYPEDPRLHRAFERIERLVFDHAARVVVTTPGTAALYAERFPQYPRERIIAVSNGFDPETFGGVYEPSPLRSSAPESRPLRVLHSGLLYPKERDPLGLFAAIAELRDAGQISARTVEFAFRASGYDAVFEPHIRRLNLGEIVRFLPSVSYKEALVEMTEADGLLALQASNCNQQIPAKLYEYMYASRPILCLTDPVGETAGLLRQLGSRHVARLDSTADIKDALLSFLRQVREGTAFVVRREVVDGFSRRSLTAEFARVLDDALDPVAQLRASAAVG